MPTLKGFLFDLDGVIADTTEMHFQAWQTIARSLGFDLSPKAYQKLKGISRQECLDHILSQGQRQVSAEEREGLLKQKDAAFLEQGAPKTLPGVREFLESAQALNFKLGIGSASRNAERTLGQLQLNHFFEIVIDGRSTTRGKPDPQVFEMAAQALQLDPAELVVFEDSPNGIEAARQGGFRAVGIGSSKALKKAELVLPHFAGYTPIALINKLNL